MGNSSSSSGEFLGSDSNPPIGHDQGILAPHATQEEDISPEEPRPLQLTAVSQPSLQLQQHPSQQSLRQLVWNPFEIPNREHCPDLQQALAYDPEAPPSPGPSIEELSQMQTEDLAAQALAQLQPPAASADVEAQRQAALAQWFQMRATTRVRQILVCYEDGHAPGPCVRPSPPGS